MKVIEEKFDLVVCGGGLAGLCAAVAAAREGLRACLVQDRPVLGGNSSSEIGVTVHGAAQFHAYARETGVISEMLIEERARNHVGLREIGWQNAPWDMVQYEWARAEKNLTLYLNTRVTDVLMTDGSRGRENADDPSAASFIEAGYRHRPAKNRSRRIAGVEAEIVGAETTLRLVGEYFLDCTGDGVVADLAGCEWRMGSESREEFGEPHAPAKASADVMGNTIGFRCIDTGAPAPFTPPDWAVRYDNADFFYKQGRHCTDPHGGFWWCEIGVPWHTITDNEDIRHELTRHVLGVWDWMKNRDPMMKVRTRTYALDWIGQVTGKRESRRVIGRHFLTEHNLAERRVFQDEIGFGGWFIDLHTPGGLLAKHSEPGAAENYSETSSYVAKAYIGPYGIPLAACISKDIDNLMMAGRNISATHAALGTVRVMGTTALMGQGCGTAAAVAKARGISLAEVSAKANHELRQRLLKAGCFLPNTRNEDPLDLARGARASASSEHSFQGAAPGGTWAHGGLAERRQWCHDELANGRCQLIALGVPELQRVSVCLKNRAAEPRRISARIVPSEGIWDYRVDTGKVFAETELVVPAGGVDAQPVWLEWECALSAKDGLRAGTFVRLDLGADAELDWVTAGSIEYGLVAQYQHRPGALRRFAEGFTASHRVEPPQPCYGPANVLDGWTRPHHFTHAWLSDPAAGFPQWLQLDWDAPRKVAEVVLTFPGNLTREYHATPPFFRDPLTPRDYRIEALIDGVWRTLTRVTGNYQRHRRHVLTEPVEVARLRVVVDSSNGDLRAAIHEIRCYAKPSFLQS